MLIRDLNIREDCQVLDRHCEAEFGARKWRIIKHLYLKQAGHPDDTKTLHLLKMLAAIVERIQSKRGRGES